MYRCKSWTIKKAEHQRTDAFELWCCRRLLRVPWNARRFNQSNLKEINTEYSLEGFMLKLKLWYFGHLMGRTDSLEKTLMLGKIEGKRRRGWQRTRLFDGITDSMEMSLSNLWETVKDRKAWSAAVHRVAESWTRLSNWTSTTHGWERDSLSGISFIRALIPLMRAQSSWSNHFPKVPPPNTISLGPRASTYELGGHVGCRYSVSPEQRQSSKVTLHGGLP